MGWWVAELLWVGLILVLLAAMLLVPLYIFLPKQTLTMLTACWFLVVTTVIVAWALLGVFITPVYSFVCFLAGFLFRVSCRAMGIRGE